MTDEKFVFVTDVREKKSIGNNAFRKRTHAGKGGSVKFPSDYLSRKELNAMNSDVKSFNINSPMKWEEFKAMPDDIKIIYVKAIRNKYRVSDSCIFRMLGISQSAGNRHFLKLGLGCGKGNHVSNPDIDGWNRWIHGISEQRTDFATENINDPGDAENVADSIHFDIPNSSSETEPEHVKAVVPSSGTLVFESNASESLKALEHILQDSNVRLTVSWTALCESE